MLALDRDLDADREVGSFYNEKKKSKREREKASSLPDWRLLGWRRWNYANQMRRDSPVIAPKQIWLSLVGVEFEKAWDEVRRE